MSHAELTAFWHDALLDHDTGRGVVSTPPSPLIAVPDHHPEGPERFRNLRALLERGPLGARVAWREGRVAEPEELLAVHSEAHVERVRRACEHGEELAHVRLAPPSWRAALASAGTALAAVDHVLAGGGPAYAFGRPTGHHAGPDTADGFCLFNQEALAAQRARARGVERVAVVDLDVHHGNGTQRCFWDRADVLTVSVHMRHGPWDPVTHPETGGPEELGAGPGLGRNVNVDLDLGVGDAGYLAALDEVVLPVLAEFGTQLLVVAAGQDAGGADPLGRQNVTMAGFRAMGARLGEACDRVLLIQEGGYQPTYGPLCGYAFVEGLLGEDDVLEDPFAFVPDDPARGAADVAAARAALAPHWPGLG